MPKYHWPKKGSLSNRLINSFGKGVKWSTWINCKWKPRAEIAAKSGGVLPGNWKMANIVNTYTNPQGTVRWTSWPLRQRKRRCTQWTDLLCKVTKYWWTVEQIPPVLTPKTTLRNLLEKVRHGLQGIHQSQLDRGCQGRNDSCSGFSLRSTTLHCHIDSQPLKTIHPTRYMTNFVSHTWSLWNTLHSYYSAIFHSPGRIAI